MKIFFKNTKTIDYVNNFYMNCVFNCKTNNICNDYEFTKKYAIKQEKKKAKYIDYIKIFCLYDLHNCKT